MTSSRRTNEPSGLEVESSTAGASGGRDLGQCPSTTKVKMSWSTGLYGVQCKYKRGHLGDHAGYNSYGDGDVFWPREED